MPAAPPLAVTVAPVKTIDVFPTPVGKLLVNFTVKAVFCITTSVGPGTCILGQVPGKGTNVGLLPAQLYPQE
jgi:hypothetical protein